MCGQSMTRTFSLCPQLFESVFLLHYLDPAATLEPLLLKVTCVALVVNRVRMPSGSPSGNVWICTVLLELAVTSFPFCEGKSTSQSTSDSCHGDLLRDLSVEINHIMSWRWSTLRAREYTLSPTVMNFGSSSSRPSHIRTSPSFPQVTKNLKKSASSCWGIGSVMLLSDYFVVFSGGFNLLLACCKKKRNIHIFAARFFL